MHLNRFDLNLLIALDALLQEKNVTRAAERVFVSQPAMSAALQKLRDYFNDPLLIRAGREMNLTPRGLALIEPVREALLSIQSTLGTHATFDPATVRRNFSVAIADVAAVRVLPRVLRRMTIEAPGVTCAIEEVSTATTARLEYGDLDLALLVRDFYRQPDAPLAESLRSTELATLRWVCLVAKDHPDIRDSLSAAQFIASPHAVALAQTQKSSTPMPEPALDIRVTTQSLLNLPHVIVGTSLIATVPEAVAACHAKNLPLQVFDPPISIHDGRELLIWHKRNEADPGHAWLRQLFIEAARDR